MKKVFLLTALLCNLSLFAQKFEAGFVGGFSASQISGDGLAGFDKGGARLGAYISYPLKNKRINFVVGMQYLQKGSKEPSGERGISNYNMNLHYLEMPFTVNYSLKNGLLLETGIGAGILVNYTEENANGTLLGESPNTLALDFLCGIQYQLFEQLKINVRYGNSITPIRKESVENSLENKDWYSSLVTFALMYKISR
ncbi:MAG: outer membrane beta-barrel protein [Flavobacteriales bacterium]|tara:strand:- start:496 stop:1089 length:594 start_codon:yes stop_codon:yes gene_type:complete